MKPGEIGETIRSRPPSRQGESRSLPSFFSFSFEALPRAPLTLSAFKNPVQSDRVFVFASLRDCMQTPGFGVRVMLAHPLVHSAHIPKRGPTSETARLSELASSGGGCI